MAKDSVNRLSAQLTHLSICDDSSDESDIDQYDMWETPVTVTGINRKKYKPIKSFADEINNADILRNLKRRKYNRVTPIQQHAIPIIKLRRDVMGCAPTGTGKTLAYLLPVLEYLEDNDLYNSSSGRVFPSALVIVPTRELAMQIYEEALPLSKNTLVCPAVAYGGVPFGKTKRDLCGGCDLLIGTPGRLKALLERHVLELDKCETLILDEADRMLEMGFEDDVRDIVEDYDLPSKSERQTLMFSATFPKREQELAKDFMQHYAFIQVGSVGEANQDILQEVLEVQRSTKLDTLNSLFKKYKVNYRQNKVKVLVFVRTKATVKWLENHVNNSSTISSGMAQQDRNLALNDFKSGRINILIATDVASRGLDIPNVDLVINYDLPNTIAVYVQRIGRTGRVGHKGHSISFYDTADACDKSLLKDLLKCLSNAHQDVPGWLLREAGHTSSVRAYIHHVREEDAWEC